MQFHQMLAEPVAKRKVELLLNIIELQVKRINLNFPGQTSFCLK